MHYQISIIVKCLRILFFSFFFVSLVGCENKNQESYYFSHPEALQQVLSRCYSYEAEPCRSAYHTAQRMTHLSQLFIQSQAAFGLRILHAQMRSADLLQQLKIPRQL